MCTPRSLFSVFRRLIEGYAGGYKSRFMLWRLEDSLLKLTLGDFSLVTRDRVKPKGISEPNIARIARTPGIVKGNNPLIIHKFGLV